MYRKTKSGVIGTIVTVVILISLVAVSNINVSEFKYVESGLATMVIPIQNGIVFLKNKIMKNNAFFSDINNLQAESDKLKEDNSELNQRLREFEVVLAENKDLKNKLNLIEQYNTYKTKPANVINKDFSNFSSTLIIDIGEREGITPNMAVISDKRFSWTRNFCYRRYL